MRVEALNQLIVGLPPSPDLRRGACVTADPDLFFDPHHEHAAKQVCRRCPVMRACLAYAVACGEKHGVWGGTTESERAEMLVKRPPHAGRPRTNGHGTRSEYGRGCRCEPCRQANADYTRKRRLLTV